MDNDRKTISASEMNKFTYCPYQWYYQRLYGTKKLNQLAKARNEQYGHGDRTHSNFQRGNEFHHTYHIQYKIWQFLKKVGVVLIAILLAAWVLWVMTYG